MTVHDPLTPPQAEGQVQAFIDALEMTSSDFIILRRTEAEKRADYKIAFAQALTTIKSELSDKPVRERGSGEEREAQALLRVKDQFRAHLIAEAASEACQERMRSLRQEVAGATSLNASARALGGGNF